MTLLVSAGLLLLVAGTQGSGPGVGFPCTDNTIRVPAGFRCKGRDPFRHP